MDIGTTGFSHSLGLQDWGMDRLLAVCIPFKAPGVLVFAGSQDVVRGRIRINNSTGRVWLAESQRMKRAFPIAYFF